MTDPGAAVADSLLDGDGLRSAFAAASQHLRESAAAVDAINVYPVPDGDTGSNMSATLRAAVERTAVLEPSATIASVLSELSRGALYGARGNSGVILSQALRGFAAGAGSPERFDAAALASGLEAAARTAYAAMVHPEEGTMLTVLREAGAAAREHAGTLAGGGVAVPCVGTLARAVACAEEAERETQFQLAALREAGVPDAGGEGVCVILRGLYAAITGSVPPVAVVAERPLLANHGRDDHEAFGFCTEFVVEPAAGTELDVEAIRTAATAGGNRSVLVAGDSAAVHVHVHTLTPDELIAAMAALGQVSRVKVEDMDTQNARFQATGSGSGRKTALVALSRGEGFDAIFESLGAVVTDLGVVVKPPAGEIAAAADALRIPDVIVLANHKNTVLAARQAASLTRCTLHVVPTATLPQGVAAALAFDPDSTATENAEAMQRAAAAVRTVEVTRAAAARTVNGIHVGAGDAIALLDTKLVAARPTLAEALVDGLRLGGAAGAGLITLYTGSDVDGSEAPTATAAVRATFPAAEVELVEGGQPLYALIASIED